MKLIKGATIIVCFTLAFLPNASGNIQAQEELADPVESPQEALEQNLDLPDLYENTLVYNGTVHPSVSLLIFDSDGPITDNEGEMIRPYINESGQFSVSLENADLIEGEDLAFRLSIARSGEDIASSTYVEVLPAQDGAEVIESNADTNEVQNAVLEATSYNWIEQEDIQLEIETVGDIEANPYYSLNGNTITIEERLESIDNNSYVTSFSPDSLNVGDLVTVYLIASGVTTVLEVEVPDTLESLAQDEETGTEQAEEPEEDNQDEENQENEELTEDDIVEEANVEDEETDHEVEEITEDEIEATEEEDEGVSVGWIIGGIIIVVVIGLIIYTMIKKNNENT